MCETLPDTQPNGNPCQHDGRIGGGDAQFHPTLGGWPHWAANHPLPTATTTCLPPSAHCTHVNASPSTPTGVLHWNATGRGRVPPVHEHGLPRPSTWPSNQLCWAVSARSQYHTDDATAHLTSKPDDDPILCSQPTAQPTPVPSQPAAAGILLLTSRGG